MALQDSTSSNLKHSISRAFFSFIISYGITYGSLVLGIGNTDLINGLSAMGVSTLFTILVSLSRDMRCVLTLCIPKFFTGMTRKLLFFWLFLFLFEQPMYSILSNSDSIEKVGPCIKNITRAQVLQTQDAYKEAGKMFAEKLEVNVNKLSTIKDIVNEVVAPINVVVVHIESGLKSMKNESLIAYEQCKGKVEKAFRDCRLNLSHFARGTFNCTARCLYTNFKICDMWKSKMLCSRFEIDEKIFMLGQFRTESAKLKKYFNTQTAPSLKINTISKANDRMFELQYNEDENLRDYISLAIYLHYIIATLLLLLTLYNAFCYKRHVLKLQANAIKEIHSNVCLCGVSEDAVRNKVGFLTKVRKFAKICFVSSPVFVGWLILLGISYILYVVVGTVNIDSSQTFAIQKDIHLQAVVTGQGFLQDIAQILFSSEVKHGSKNISVGLEERCIDEPVPPCSLLKVTLIFSLILVLTSLIFLKQWFIEKCFEIVKYFYPEEFTAEKENIRLQQLKLKQAKNNLAEERLQLE